MHHVMSPTRSAFPGPPLCWLLRRNPQVRLLARRAGEAISRLGKPILRPLLEPLDVRARDAGLRPIGEAVEVLLVRVDGRLLLPLEAEALGEAHDRGGVARVHLECLLEE